MPKNTTKDTQLFFYPDHQVTVEAIDRAAADEQLEKLLKENKKGDEASE